MTSLLKRTLPALLMALALATPAYPWSREGHMAIAAIARGNLSDDARKHVVKLLGNDDLAAISVYMDELRTAAVHAGELAFDPEAQQFNHDFPDNFYWHYVDMPLGTKAYELDGPFAKPDDVVHSIEMAVSVLEGGGDSRISKAMALRMIVHFVGDIHQPLHTVSGYYIVAPDSTVKLVTDPVAAVGLPGDKGGNVLFFGPARYDELHNYWDYTLPTRITHSTVTADLVKVLEPKVAAEGAAWKSPGDYHHWAEGWATESLVAAQTAYKGITFGASTPDPKGGLLKIMITLPPDYDATCVPIAEERLAKGGYHLAEILNAIHWAD
jgi:hypothetical protein